jgi:protein AbiQ
MQRERDLFRSLSFPGGIFMGNLKFYEIGADYINYLLGMDKRVPRVDYSGVSPHNKFLCGIVLTVGEHEYFAPISSFKIPQKTNVIIKDGKGRPISSIRFSFMIPVPKGVATLKDIDNEPSPKYKRLLEEEIRFCNKNVNAIYRQARFVYNSVVVKKDAQMIQNCCDFKLLEKACVEYTSNSKDK